VEWKKKNQGTNPKRCCNNMRPPLKEGLSIGGKRLATGSPASVWWDGYAAAKNAGETVKKKDHNYQKPFDIDALVDTILRLSQPLKGI
jgi:hypothetical protein